MTLSVDIADPLVTRPAVHRLVLGSASPRRLELLAQIGIHPDEVVAADIDETPARDEQPRDYVRRMAREKALALQDRVTGTVLSADTIVTAGRRILGKPQGRDQARAFLTLLSGRRHRVLTAVAVLSRHGSADRLIERLVETQVRFRPLSGHDIDRYLDTGEWQGKAGGYAIQGHAASFVPWIQGSFTSVVGLPLAETATILAGLGHFGQSRDQRDILKSDGEPA